MLDRYSKIVRYEAHLTALSPIRSGGSEGDTDAILRSAEGRAFIQGPSLTGALRDWIKNSDYRDLNTVLFGPDRDTPLSDSREGDGALVISDLVFEAGAEEQSRPRLRIDGATGAARQGAKFSVTGLAAGTQGRFTLLWFGSGQGSRQQQAVEAALAAMNAGDIRLGAQKSNGFGRVGLAVTVRHFDMTDSADRKAWIADSPEGEPLPLPRRAESRFVRFTVKGLLPNVLIKAEASVSGGGTTFVNIRENGKPLIPGSSVKGAVHARAGSIERQLCDSLTITERLFGREARDGDNGSAGTLRFSDADLSRGSETKISRIRINKFTGGVMRGALFSEQPLSAPVTISIAAPDDPAGCALLLFALRDLGLGLYNLGSGGSIGRGQLTGAEIRAVTPDGKTLTLSFDGERRASLSDPDGLWPVWAEALKGGNA